MDAHRRSPEDKIAGRTAAELEQEGRMNIEIADRLVELRKKNNLSQEALAGKLGISRQAVSKWERAEASPDTDNLIQIARLYNISLDELLGTGTGGKSSAPPAGGQPPVLAAERLQKERGESNPVSIIEEEPVRINYKALNCIPAFLIVTAAYMIMGAVWNLWHPGWLLFFLPPIWHSALMAAERRNAKYFAYPVLVVLIYLCVGLFFNLWHPGWILFMTIPLYYPMTSYFQRVYRSQKAELDKLMEGNAGEDGRDL